MNRLAFRWALNASLALRVGISGLLAAAWMVMRPFIASTLAQQPINPLFPVSYTPPGEALLGIWNRWDGYRYFLLAYSGYSDPTNVANTVFYPLYPMILRLMWKLTGLDIIALSLVLSTLFALFMFFMLVLVVEDQFDSDTAKYSLIALAVYPTALFLVGPYTESLFLGLTLLAFYLARKDRWLWAGLAGALASLTRGPGVLTAFALAWIAYTKWRGDRFSLSPRLIRMALGTAAPGLAGLGFILWRQWMGFPPVADVLAEHFGVTMVNPLVGVFTALRTMLQLPTLPVVLDGLTVLVWLGLFVLVILRWRRIPMEWILYMGLNLLVTTSKVTTIISPMQSIGRYVLVLFPAFVMIGEWLAHTTPRKRFAYIAGSGSVLLVYCALYAVGFFIG